MLDKVPCFVLYSNSMKENISNVDMRADVLSLYGNLLVWKMLIGGSLIMRIIVADRDRRRNWAQ